MSWSLKVQPLGSHRDLTIGVAVAYVARTLQGTSCRSDYTAERLHSILHSAPPTPPVLQTDGGV